MGKGYQHDTKIDAEIHDFFKCFQKRRKLKNYWLFNRKRGSDNAKRYQQSIENRCKIKARKKATKRSQKETNFDAKIYPKFKKGAKGEPRGRQQSQKSSRS
jgi:hypothetical protein